MSVIVSTYNLAPYLSKALDSILSQTDHGLALEVLVIDDESTDGTARVIEPYRDRLRYMRVPHCGLPGMVRNYGLERARGTHFAFLDGDDYWLPGSLAARWKALRAHPELGFVFSNFYELRGEELTLKFSPPLPPSGWIFEDLFRRSFVHTSTVLARRALVEECGGFEPRIRYGEDYHLWLHLTKRAPALFLPEPLAVYRQRSGSVTRMPWVRNLPQMMAVVRAIGKEFGVPSRTIRERINPMRILVAKECIKEHRFGEGLRWLLPALVTEPLRTSSTVWATVKHLASKPTSLRPATPPS